MRCNALRCDQSNATLCITSPNRPRRCGVFMHPILPHPLTLFLIVSIFVFFGRVVSFNFFVFLVSLSRTERLIPQLRTHLHISHPILSTFQHRPAISSATVDTFPVLSFPLMLRLLVLSRTFAFLVDSRISLPHLLSSKQELLCKPMPHNNPPLRERLPAGDPDDNRGMAVRALCDVDRVFAPAYLF